MKDNFTLDYETKKLFNNHNEFYYSFYFWIFGLRILSSVDCIHLEQYDDIFNEYISKEVKHIINEKINKREKIGKNWINFLIDNVDPIYEDFDISSIYRYIKK